MLICWCRTDICSCKLSAKVSLMLDNPFLVPSLCKLNHISFCFIQISTKSPAKLLIPLRESTVFWSHPRCFGPLGKFQHNIKISIKTARVFRLSVSYDYANKFWIYSLVLQKRLTEKLPCFLPNQDVYFFQIAENYYYY